MCSPSVLSCSSRHERNSINRYAYYQAGNYNELLAEDLALSPGEGIILQDSIHNRDVTVAHEKLQAFVREHESKDLRVTLVRPNGKVIYDNMSSDYEHFANHAKREEIAEALKTG